MSWIHSSSTQRTRSFRSSSLTASDQITSGKSSSTSSQISSSSTMSSTESVQSSTSDKPVTKSQTLASQKLYLLLPNHKCPNKKTCPFHPPEEEEEELEEAEVTLVNKRRAMSLASLQDQMISEQLLSEKLAKINQQISSNLLEGNKLHLPRKTSHDITLPTADLDHLRFDHYSSDTFPATSSTREESVTSDYDLDSGVTFDSCSDRELDEDSLPLIQEEVVIPDIVLPAEFELKTEEDIQETDQQLTTVVNVETSIQINEVSTVDSGTFTIHAASHPEETDSSATVTIEEHVPESFSKPSFAKELEYLTITEGSLVQLECAVIGDPKPNIKWLKNNQRIDFDDSYKINSYEDGTVTLVIEAAKVEDSGSYTCVADNVAGSASTQSKIRVHKAVEERSVDYQRPEDKAVKKYQLLVTPEFTATLKNKTTPDGVNVRLNCSVAGKPEPTHRWFKDEKEIFDGPDFTLRNNGGLLSLEIACAKQSLAGTYKVEASNSEGTISCSCLLQVEEEKEIETVELDFLRPKFTRKIQEVHVKEGEDATFTCTATGKPVPAFKWQRDMINIAASNFVEMESNDQGHAHLTLKNVKPSDVGLYYCVAQSKAGRAKCSAYLYVKERSTSPEIIKEDEHVRWQARKESSVDRGGMLGSPPSLEIFLPDKLDIIVGGRLKLDCSVQGYPMPLVSWHKGDRGLMYSQRHRIVACATLHTMEIPQVMALDKGEYIVRATNIYGTIQSSCYVNILPKGSTVASPDYNKEAVVVTTKQNLQAPFFVKHLPKTIDAILGMNIRLDCILREGIELIQWLKSKSPFQDSEKVKKEVADEGFHGEFSPSEAKSYDKPSSQTVDKRQTDAVINRSEGQEEKKLEPISFTTTPKNLVQQAGGEAVFECSTAGSTESEVKWYKDDKLLTANNRIRVATVGSKHTLRITDVRSSDEGEYVCKLDKLPGTKTGGAILTVTAEIFESQPSETQSTEQEQKPLIDNRAQEQHVSPEKQKKEQYEKPSFRQPLPDAISVNHADNVELVCQLTSADVIRVKWELDGKELPKEARYHVSSDKSSNEHKLTIHDVTERDSGKYTCVVDLKNGDLIHTSTELNVSAAKPEPTQKGADFRPHFTTKLKDTMVKDGEGLVLECDVEGNPRPQILWLRDDLEIFDSPDFQISTIGCHSKLQINDIYPEDEGSYSCRAVNNLGEAVNTCYVTVEDLGGEMSADSASTNSSRSYDKYRSRRVELVEGDLKKKAKKEQEKPELPPELVVKPRRQFIDDGGIAKFKASFDGSKNTIIFWSKDGQVLKEDDHFKLYEADGFHFLEVQNVSVEDIGMYSVTVQNLAGTDTADAELEVFEKPKLLTRSGPEWEQALQNLTVEEEDTGVELSCTCKELVQPLVRWFHNGKEVFSGFHMKLNHTAQTATLTIKEIQEKDAGEFKCVMTGKNGELETSCILTIKYPEEMEPPVFVKELHDMEVEEGDKLELDVEVKGTSPDTVSWYHNNVKIMHDNLHYLITSAGHVQTLTLLHANSESSGEYMCEANNDDGVAETYCFVEVREVKHPEPPSFAIHPLNLSAHEGETAIFTCQVKGQPMPSVLWKKGGVAIATNQKFKLTRIHDCHTLTVYNTNYMDGGEYICYLHNTEGDKSHVCILHVTTDQDNSYQSQTVDLQKIGLNPCEDLQNMSLSKHESGEHRMSSPIISRRFRHREMLNFGDKIAESQTTTTAQKTSFGSTIETTAATGKLTDLPNHVDGETGLHTMHHQHKHNNHHNSKPDKIIHVKAPTDIIKSSSYLHSSSQSNLSDSKSKFKLDPNKVQQKVEETNSTTNNDGMDYRSILKHRQMSPLTQPEKPSVRSHDTDFRVVKIGIASSESNNLPVTQTSKTLFLHGEGLTSVFNSTSSSLSSSSLSPSNEKSKDQMLQDFTHMRKETNVHDFELASVQQTFGASKVTDGSSTYFVEPSQMARQSRGRSGSDYSSSFYNQHVDEVSSTQNLIKITSGKSENANIITEKTESFNILRGNSSLPKNMGKSDAFSTEKTSDSAIMKQDASELSIKTMDNVLFTNEKETANIRMHSSIVLSNEHPNFLLNTPQTTVQGIPESDSHCVSERDHQSIESNKWALKHKHRKVNRSQLSARKISIIEFNPSSPQSEAFKLEVTSVSASVPQRQSLSSTRLHSEPHSAAAPNQSCVYNSDLKLEENDDVFTCISKDRSSSYIEPGHKPRPDELKHNSQSFESNIPREIIPSNTYNIKKGILSECSAQGSANHLNDLTDNEINRSRTRFSEYLSGYKEHGHHEEERLTYRLSTASRSETISCSDNSAKASHIPVSTADNVIDDFRNVKLKPAATKVKDKSDLTRSKFMSKSTESIFTDIKLKPVAKPSDSYKKSEISSNAERIKANSKSSDLSKLFSKSSYQNSAKINPSPRTTTTATSTTSTFSDCLKTFNSDAKPKSFLQNSKYQKPASSSKVRTSNGKYEKASSGGVVRTNSHRKSKGIGAKFEAAIKDLKTSTGQVPYTSVSLARNTRGSVRTSIQDKSAGYHPGRLSENLQLLKSTDTTPENGLNKTLDSESNSCNALLVSSSESHQNKISDWVKKRQSIQIDNSTTFTSSKMTFRDRERLSTTGTPGMVEGNLETRGLNKTKQSSFFNTVKDKQDVKTDQLNRNVSNCTEVRTSARPERSNVHDTSDIEWARLRSAQDKMKTKPRQGDVRVSQFECKTDRRITQKYQEGGTYLEDGTKLATVVSTDSKSVKISNNEVETFPESLPKPSQVCNSYAGGSESACKNINTSEIYKTEFRMTPKIEVQVPLSSTKLAKPPMETNEYPLRWSSVESHSENENTRSSLMKQKNQRHIPIYPVNDTELSPFSVPLKLSTDDLELVLSVTSISSSSSDASTATVDSGYTGNYLKQPACNDKKDLVSETLLPDNTDSLNRTANSRAQNAEFSWEPLKVKKNTDSQQRQNDNDGTTDLNYIQGRTRKLGEEGTRELSTTAILQKVSHRHPGPDVTHAITDDDRITNVDLKQMRSQQRNFNEDQMLESASAHKEPRSISNLKDNEYTDVTELILPRYISRRERRKLEMSVAASRDLKLETETRETVQKRLSESEESDVTTTSHLTSNKSSGKKQLSIHYENPSVEVPIAKIGKYSQLSNVISDCTMSESTFSINSDRPRSKFGHEYTIHEQNTCITKTMKDFVSEQDRAKDQHKSKSKEDTAAYFSLNESEITAAAGSRFNFKDEVPITEGKEGSSQNKHLIEDSYDESSIQSWRNSRFQNRKVSLSTASHQDEFRKLLDVSSTTLPATSTASSALPLTTSTSASLLMTTVAVQSKVLETTTQQKDYPPSFPMPLHNSSVMFGSNAILECQVTGNPRPDVKWLLNQKLLETSDKIQITYSDVTARLTIRESSKEQGGDYTCCARNSLGTVSSHCTLRIEGYQTNIGTENNTNNLKTKAVTKTDAGKMSVCQTNSTGTDQVTADNYVDGGLPFKPRDVAINTRDTFEDLYTMEKEVGRGKFGVVYKCKQKTDDTVWAAKVVRCREKDKVGLRREIAIMNKLRHPKLLLLWDAFETPRQMVLVMEYVAAGELFERVVADDFVLTEIDCIHFMRQICEGVAYMHNNYILHLDLKPENVLCIAENSNRIKIIDFGLAQFYKPGQSTRVMFGTPEFVAPEVINYDEISFVTDMWSLGVICYVLLSGLSPFLGDSDSETLANVTDGEYDFDDEAFEEISEFAKDFICQLLIKQKEKRLLTEQCLAHTWLNQDEVDGTTGKPLNTERLKKFMVRRKWLKTGNAVKAISRLLKSNSLGGFGAFENSFSTDSGIDTPSPNTVYGSQRTEEALDDTDYQGKSNSVEDHIIIDNSKSLAHVAQGTKETNFSSFEEYCTSAGSQSKIEVPSHSISQNAISEKTNSAKESYVSSLSGTISGEEIEAISCRHETNDINRSSQIVASEVTDLSQTMGKTASLLSSSSSTMSRQSEGLLLTPENKISLQNNSKRTEVKQLLRVSDETALPHAPYFIKLMTRCKTCAGDVARFDVVASGNPLPHVTWFFEEEEIHSDSRHTLSSNEATRSFSLIIRNVEEDDEGEYSCKAVNSHGENACAAELVVFLL